MAPSLVTVTRCWTATEAEAMRGLLLAAGIPAVLADQHLNTVDPFASPALGFVRIDVPPAFLARAREVIERTTGRPPGAPRGEPDGDEPDACPACGKPLPERVSACAACGWTLPGDDEE